ncbi:hypothetical protein [Bacillus suaedaesalsae]|uniref:Uncharacterized protein n=1 Tax=Bacillus suaedaesalsae TaxID=2810349 RepID=A0ABS2DD02_9BACI|nr:hypothetical protein [Bacillus suaedaesalsae]MBM6616342.1 hypothetical protein [Bacillus suaedaesalsae]
MSDFPIYTDSLSNIWYHDLSPDNIYTYNDSIDHFDQDNLDEFDEAITFRF